MNPRNTSARVVKSFCLMMVLLSGLALGCAEGGGATTSIRLSAAERPDIATGNGTSGTIQIPGETAFNYPKFSSGQEGNDARGSAIRVSNTAASCSAEVTNDGKAWGAFQLGYGFDHQSATPSKCVVRVRLNTKETANEIMPENAEAVKKPTGLVSLVFILKDANGVTITEETLVTNNLRKGPRSASITHDVSFDATLLPDHGYYVVLSGRCDVLVKAEDVAANLALEVSDISIDLKWSPAKSATKTADSGTP